MRSTLVAAARLFALSPLALAVSSLATASDTTVQLPEQRIEARRILSTTLADLEKGFPDGIAFDSFGNLWCTLVMVDQLIALTPQGDKHLLLDDSGRAWIVDFDKCGIRGEHHWKQQNLDRLLRSLRKEKRKRASFFWEEASWEPLTSGYGDTSNNLA